MFFYAQSGRGVRKNFTGGGDKLLIFHGLFEHVIRVNTPSRVYDVKNPYRVLV